MLQYVTAVLAAKRTDDRGASAVEYGLLVAAIAALIVIIVFALGGIVRQAFQDTCSTIADKDNSASTVTASCA